jgi:hypothetical protein
MRGPFRSLDALAVVLVSASMMSYAVAADPSPSQCLYRDAHYGQGAIICLAPNVAQQCGPDSKWDPPAGQSSCANAQISVPGMPPNQCIYHDVKYATGARICVGPRLGMGCAENGSWVLDKDIADACKNAQIPAPTYPASPASGK